MIDIHNHSLFGVDDGPKELEECAFMLNEAYEQGITSVILTPHYRKGMFKYQVEDIQRKFDCVTQIMRNAKIPIRLYLGCEYHVNENIFEYMTRGRTRTMAGSHYILMEYEYDTPFDEILEYTQRARSTDYIPIIAHAERYKCLVKKPKLCEILQEEGAWIQCNADAVLGLEGWGTKLFTATLLKHQWVDFIGSDSHGLKSRVNHLAQARQFIEKKYGKEQAEELFEINPQRILKIREGAGTHE